MRDGKMKTFEGENTMFRSEEFIALTRGRLSLDRSVWYMGHLMTFLATAEDTQ